MFDFPVQVIPVILYLCDVLISVLTSLTWATNAGLLTFATGRYVRAYVGYLSDRMDEKGRFGRRKPFVAGGYILMAISALFYAVKPSDDKMIVRIWYVATTVVFTAGSTMFGVAYSAWLVESTKDSSDYSKIFTTPVPLGNALFGILGLFVYNVMGVFASALYYIMLGSVATFLLCTKVPNEVRRTAKKDPSLIPSVRMAWRTNEFRRLFVNSTMITTAAIVSFSLTAYLLLIGFGITTMER